KLLQNPSNTQNYNGYSYVLNNPLKYTDPSGWAYGGYAYFTYKQGFNFETAQNGSAGDMFWDPNPGKGYMVDGMPGSKSEFLASKRAGGEINVPGLLAELFQVINADGSISVVDTPGEAVDLYNAANHKKYVNGIPAKKIVSYSDGTSQIKYGYINPFDGIFDEGKIALYSIPKISKISAVYDLLIDKTQGGGGGWGQTSDAINKYTSPAADLAIGGAEYNIGKILVDRGKYGSLHPETIIRTPIGNISTATKVLQTTGSVLKVAGATLGVVGMVGTVAQYNAGQISGAEASLDLIMGGVGFIPGGGWIVSGTYFLIAKPLYNYATKP
ncbi:MAG TPA: hypothetical protein PLI68_06745, partial [Bacteroidia bacterium]|nr:hypothetical protein [Bacteroidia bacterium]